MKHKKTIPRIGANSARVIANRLSKKYTNIRIFITHKVSVVWKGIVGNTAILNPDRWDVAKVIKSVPGRVLFITVLTASTNIKIFHIS